MVVVSVSFTSREVTCFVAYFLFSPWRTESRALALYFLNQTFFSNKNVPQRASKIVLKYSSKAAKCWRWQASGTKVVKMKKITTKTIHIKRQIYTWREKMSKNTNCSIPMIVEGAEMLIFHVFKVTLTVSSFVIIWLHPCTFHFYCIHSKFSANLVGLKSQLGCVYLPIMPMVGWQRTCLPPLPEEYTMDLLWINPSTAVQGLPALHNC